MGPCCVAAWEPTGTADVVGPAADSDASGTDDTDEREEAGENVGCDWGAAVPLV